MQQEMTRMYPDISRPLAELQHGRQNWALVVLIEAAHESAHDEAG